MTLLFILLFIALALWAALVAAGVVTWGTYGVLLAAGLVAYGLSLLPWRDWDARLRPRR